jgi:hypothetical protein
VLAREAEFCRLLAGLLCSDGAVPGWRARRLWAESDPGGNARAGYWPEFDVAELMA